MAIWKTNLPKNLFDSKANGVCRCKNSLGSLGIGNVSRNLGTQKLKHFIVSLWKRAFSIVQHKASQSNSALVAKNCTTLVFPKVLLVCFPVMAEHRLLPSFLHLLPEKCLQNFFCVHIWVGRVGIGTWSIQTFYCSNTLEHTVCAEKFSR